MNSGVGLGGASSGSCAGLGGASGDGGSARATASAAAEGLAEVALEGSDDGMNMGEGVRFLRRLQQTLANIERILAQEDFNVEGFRIEVAPWSAMSDANADHADVDDNN